jgi:hypothetical protein
MVWETKKCFDVMMSTSRFKGECDKVEVLDGGVLRIENDHVGGITHLFARHAWVSCDVWEEAK